MPVRLQEIPDWNEAIDVPGGSADGALRRVLVSSGPRVTTAFQLFGCNSWRPLLH